ncbi:hypothetical protein L226DRAFT_615457 [Lentinus tigrinus ALCF2SS1-7]|uniref:uncharacterized protein n=1 Tax=Lentinus tigrinus ALCF2SS1-7 TaxID=1328758 RepID=UPI001165D55D|nr:hypothetical protein L226DRAFT_615457 [Lentinus tigrinus ALCF2SS1-7]
MDVLICTLRFAEAATESLSVPAEMAKEIKDTRDGVRSLAEHAARITQAIYDTRTILAIMAHPGNDQLSDASCINICNLTRGLQPYEAASQVYRSLRIPSPRRRKGLRRIHTRLTMISTSLSRLFDFAYPRKEWQFCGVVAVIWGDMCGDAVLCRGLLERGLLLRALRLVDVDGSFTLLPLLSLLARHGDEAVKTAVLAGLIRIFTNWKAPWPTFKYSEEHILVILRHCLNFTTRPELPAGLSVSAVADLALTTLEDPEVSYEAIIHAIPILIACATAFPREDTETLPRILDFLAVLLHSDDLPLRSACVWVFYSLCGATEQPSISRHRHQPRSLQYLHFPELASRNVPPGSERESIRIHTATLRNLLKKLCENQDLYAFGIGMATLLSSGPFIHSTDDFSDFERSTLQVSTPDTWDSLLSNAAEALRSRTDPDSLNMADVLTLEHLARVGPSEAAAAHAREVLRRELQHSYAYAILSEHSKDLEEALQASTKGLQLAGLTVYLRRRLEVSAIELSFAKAQTLLLQAGPMHLKMRQAGLESLNVMGEHIRAFVPTVPEDLRDLLPIMDLNIIYYLIQSGNTYSLRFKKLKLLRDRIDRSARIMARPGFESAERPMKAAHETLTRHFSQGFKKWAAVVKRFDALDECYRPPIDDNVGPLNPNAEPLLDLGADKQSDVSSRWWEPDNEPTLASLLHGPLRCSCDRCGSMQPNPGLPILFACSWCSCRTAIVRKCSRCHDAWYCDTQCQRAHWPQHRTCCRKPEPTCST